MISEKHCRLAIMAVILLTVEMVTRVGALLVPNNSIVATNSSSMGEFLTAVDVVGTAGNVALLSMDDIKLDVSPEIAVQDNRKCRNNDTWVYGSTMMTGRPNENCQTIRLLAESLRNELCQLNQVQQNCPVTCGICCEDDPDFMFERLNGLVSGCDWISKNKNRIEVRQNRYCNTMSNGTMIGTACPKSCDECVSPQCGTCCEDDPDFLFERRNGLVSGCDWISKNKNRTEVRQKRYCNTMSNGTMIGTACPKSCNECVSTRSNRPNLVMVITDEHNLRTLSCYRDYLLTKFEKEKVDVWGDVSLDTPNIDSLAAGGALYTNFYTVDPVCTPSRASFMSGMYPPFTGAMKNNLAMDQDVVTWAEILRNNGYATSYIGKFHLDGRARPGWEAPDGREFGFDDNQFRFNRGHWKYFEIVDDTLVKEYEDKDRNRFAGRYETSYATDFLMDRGIEFIEHSAAAGNPFAVVISIPDPHAPNKNRPPYDTMFSNLQFKVPDTGRKNLRFKPASPRLNNMVLNETSVDSVDEFIAEYENDFFIPHMQQYYGMVKCVDENIGKLIQKLKDIGLEDDTVVVFTSDHGDLLMEHGRLNKGSPYKTSAGIPLIIRYPRKIKSGKIIETAYSSVDFAPTILSLLGVKDTSAATFQGVDGSQELTTSEDVSAQQDKIIFSFDGDKPTWAAAIMGGYKLVISKGDVPWLFDMNIDHDELVNYADSEFHQPVYTQLRDALIDAMLKFRSPLFESNSFLYLDMPACRDLDDALFRIKMPAFFCKDVGVTITKSKCIDAKQVQRNCPWTCGTCCIDSPGKMWVDAEAKDCNSLSSYCQDASVQAFCPQTCNICG